MGRLSRSLRGQRRGPAGNGGTAVAVWAPAEPTLTVETDLADFDEFEVRVYDTSRDQRLVAAVELISPGNKDRPQQRSQFTAKCAALLRNGVSLVLADVVTERWRQSVRRSARSDRPVGPVAGAQPPATYAVACCWRPRGASRWLETWNRELKLGLPLPCLPLWLTEELAITLDLEASYEQTCRDLRID